jgi:glucose/mannose-6-phosphate isomerase
MIDSGVLTKFDKQKMYEAYEKWPKIAKESFENEINKVDFKDIDHIVFAGMGGSGAIGDIISSVLSKNDIHVKIVKGYHLPNTVDSNTLVVVSSVSGNTIETLSILESASKKNCKLIGFSSGGKMEKYCSNNEINFRKIEKFHSPRASLTSFLYSILNVLEPLLPLKVEEIKESIQVLEIVSKKISYNNLTETNESLSLSNWISGIPLIYYPWGLESAATRFKNSLQENAKTHVIAEDVLEASHNGLVSWEKLSNVKPILLQGKDDFVKTKERYQIIKEYFNINKIEFKEVISVEGSILTKLVNLIYVLDYSSIYLAVRNGIDPSPVNSIDFVKNKL